MNTTYRILIGIGIILMFGLFSFTIGREGIAWTWFDVTSGVLGLIFSIIVLLILVRRSNRTGFGEEELDLPVLESHDIDGYEEEDFV